MLSRRHFLQSTSLLSLSPLVPSMLCRAAQASPAEPDQKVLVVIQLDGGNDGINTVVPFADDGYARARKKLRLPADQLHKLNDHVGLHPRMQGAKELYDDGRLSIVQGVGYPNPDRSHFRSMRIWQTASFDDQAHDGYGWLGRALDQPDRTSSRSRQGGVYIGEDQPPVALWGRRSTTVGLSRLADLTLTSDGLWDPRKPFAPDSPHPSPLHQFVTRQAVSAYSAAERFRQQEAALKQNSTASYPSTGLARRLELIAKLLKSNSPARVFYTTQGGYDTHSTQLYTHAQLLSEFSQGLQAFLDDLRASRLDDRVVVLAFSEFGRRVAENDSHGTDHGTAGPVFLAGAPVHGGLVGETPSLTDLDGGDLRMQCSFQRVYATLLDRWLGVPSQEVLGEDFEPLPLLPT